MTGTIDAREAAQRHDNMSDTPFTVYSSDNPHTLALSYYVGKMRYFAGRLHR